MKKYCVVCNGIEKDFDSEEAAMGWATEQGESWELFDENTGYCLESSEDIEIFEKLEPFF
tara:strand:- start:254 stop:433 length:180 start_codon:yes stop_codon:yes gene_type:complete